MMHSFTCSGANTSEYLHQLRHSIDSFRSAPDGGVILEEQDDLPMRSSHSGGDVATQLPLQSQLRVKCVA